MFNNRYSGRGFDDLNNYPTRTDYDSDGNAIRHERRRFTNPNLNQRVVILVDVQNMFYAAKELHGGKINYKKLLDFVLRGRKLTRAIAYCVTSPEKDATNFLRYLEAVGFEVRPKELKRRPDGTTRGDWEVGLTVDALTIAPKVDTICLITGDGDYTLLAQALRGMGVKVEGYGFREFTSQELISSTNRFYSFDERIIGEYIPTETADEEYYEENEYNQDEDSEKSAPKKSNGEDDDDNKGNY
ncbi:MAG: hypothetical protein Kow0090_00450 [Myxococcota bacterium]